MPGIYGFFNRKARTSDISKMSLQMNSDGSLVQDREYIDDAFQAARTHLGTINKENSPFLNKGLAVWLEGECYNLNDLKKRFPFPQSSLEEGILSSYHDQRLKEYARHIDGYFSCLIYDKNENKITIVTDRYGLKLIYFYCNEGVFAWSSEVKALIALDFVKKTINEKSFEPFIKIGYMLDQDTWFKHINLVKPASILEFDISSGKISQDHYWKWGEIKKNDINFQDASRELGRLIIDATRKRFSFDDRIGVSLSGGLDSRAIFASLDVIAPKHVGYAYTLGQKKSSDILIAKKVISKSNWDHEVFNFSKEDWLKSRLEGIWNSDGMLNFMHMHGNKFQDQVKSNISINLNGFLGDAVCGGTYLRAIEKMDSSPFLHQEYKKLKHTWLGSYCNNNMEYLLNMNRGRRFINMGISNSLRKIDQRMPFFDNDLLEFVFSIDEKFRYGNKLYSDCLLKTFPKFFQKIPWQATGKPLSCSHKSSFSIISYLRDLKTIILKNNFRRYKSWINEPKTMEFLKELLDPTDSIYYQYYPVDLCKVYIDPHLHGKNNFSNQIMSSATMELYLRKVFSHDLGVNKYFDGF